MSEIFEANRFLQTVSASPVFAVSGWGVSKSLIEDVPEEVGHSSPSP